ncbi:MAG TPA: hypothetical protein VHM89_08235 [Acidimicrobiales bacterium]|nr:hypothetical protein [Acidimicrobiales bacterium]
MTLAVAVVAGWLAARLLWTVLRPTLAQPLLLRRNWRDHDVPTAAGIVIALAVVVVEAGRALAGSAGIGPAGVGPGRAAAAVLVVGMALVGLLDDLVGGDDARGFRGHLTELVRGRLTTGGVKLFAGLAVAVVAVAVADGGDAGSGRLVADAALVALTANMGNLLDRRPGRAAKAGLAAFATLAVATAGPTSLVGVAVVAGAVAALLLDDLREHLMLGDTGANVLGGAVGLGVVVACAPATRTSLLAVVVVLNAASEVISFGRVIDAVPPLRALDRWGRRF